MNAKSYQLKKSLLWLFALLLFLLNQCTPSYSIIYKYSGYHSDGYCSVVGRVLDKSIEEPLIGANVIAKWPNIGASTDINGYYKIENLLPGEYKLVVKYIGYEKQVVNVILNSNDLLVIDFNLNYVPIKVD